LNNNPFKKHQVISFLNIIIEFLAIFPLLDKTDVGTKPAALENNIGYDKQFAVPVCGSYGLYLSVGKFSFGF
jgi:hypothetical protein